ncbi:MAG: HAMP domain-containing sensor histidine kinase [Thermomicrobiales bacterium]
MSATAGARDTVTIDAEQGDERFRALVLPQQSSGGWIVVTQSLSEVDAAIDRLVWTLLVAGGVLVVVLGAMVFWVQRLGLRPIARVTAAAEAIAAGDRSYRLAGEDARTEAGKLSHAFNLMLDERDESDVRFRQFVADASHELRTPLTSVRGYLELYREGAFRSDGEMDDAVRRMSAETTRMYGLVEDLLVLASLDEGRPLRRDVVDLGQILRDAAEDAGAVQPARRIVLVAPEVGPVVVGDGSLLVQGVGILVANALAHTPESADVTLTAMEDGGQAFVTVADKGPGLDAESAQHIFDRFWRGTKARERSRGRGGGAGLGLSIARSIVEAHGGTISVQSTPGVGTAFAISLPKQGRTRTASAS